MEWVDLGLPDASVRLARGWLAAGDAATLMQAVRRQVPWEVHRIRLFGREVDSPRLSCWIGDPGTAYRYSGKVFEPHPWPPALADLRQRIQDDLARPFNSVLANLYRSGTDAMGWHSDNEPELGPEPVIASLSLGASRRFVLRHRTGATLKVSVDLEPGSLLVMAGRTQERWKHALPRTARPVGERINLTFRYIFPG